MNPRSIEDYSRRKGRMTGLETIETKESIAADLLIETNKLKY
jgi:hypothetical protein